MARGVLGVAGPVLAAPAAALDVPHRLWAALPAGERVPLLVVVASLVGWVLLRALVLAATRPRPIRPGTATEALAGDEPPAVVSLLTGDWSVGDDAAEATLLDLVARGYLELRQPDADPSSSVVRLVTADPAAAAEAVSRRASVVRVGDSDPSLTPYEEQVLDRVRDVAARRESDGKGDGADGAVPLTALSFRSSGEAWRWTDRFEAAVVHDARGRGLVSRGMPRWASALLAVSALVPGVAISWLAWRAVDGADRGALSSGFIPFVLMARSAMRPRGLRPTAEGRDAAAGWLGVRRYLEGEEAFADLPPVAVTVWDRYLAYGTALGVCRAVTAVVDLGMANRRQVWSSYGGHWHQVLVTYPRAWARYGAPAPRLVGGSVAATAAGFGLMWLYRLTGPAGWTPPVGPGPIGPHVMLAVLVVGGLLAAWGVYRLLRAVADLVTTETLQGEVLWIAPWGAPLRRRVRRGSAPHAHYLAVDDGTGDRTTAWALPPDIVRGFGPGAVVEVTVRPWSRRVTALTVLQSRNPRPSETSVTTVAGAVVAGPPGAVPPPLRAGDLAARLGVPLEPAYSLGLPGLWRYPVAAGRGEVMLAAGRGVLHRTLFDVHRRGHRLGGVGDEAYLLPTGAAARVGDLVVRVAVPAALEIPPEGVAAALAATLYAALDQARPPAA